MGQALTLTHPYLPRYFSQGDFWRYFFPAGGTGRRQYERTWRARLARSSALCAGARVGACGRGSTRPSCVCVLAGIATGWSTRSSCLPILGGFWRQGRGCGEFGGNLGDISPPSPRPGGMGQRGFRPVFRGGGGREGCEGDELSQGIPHARAGARARGVENGGFSWGVWGAPVQSIVPSDFGIARYLARHIRAHNRRISAWEWAKAGTKTVHGPHTGLVLV
jgi:hypothetical protein